MQELKSMMTTLNKEFITTMKVKIFNEHDEPTAEYFYCKIPLEF